jgi:hypothetical protein
MQKLRPNIPRLHELGERFDPIRKDSRGDQMKKGKSKMRRSFEKQIMKREERKQAAIKREYDKRSYDGHSAEEE